ncbi:MAG: penicillin acylase family protein [Rhodothermaeota bacterium MED-G18]|nr:MAG: penicillin acylase family protein [Rhodothermaeota bacterium MED-G18]
MRSLISLLSILLLSCSSDVSLDLNERVEVLRDSYGINHIYAKNQRDLFFMQGYLSARDRLFQFEIWRRQATGTVSEIFGEQELKRDIGTRLFMFRGDIRDELNHYHDDGYEIITSYTDGVNAYINEVLKDPQNLPIEFKLLDIKPQPWGPEVVISRHQGLLGNIGQELDIGRAVSRVGEEKVKELLWLHPKEPSLKLNKKISSEDLDNDILELYNAFRKPIDFKDDYIVEKYRNNNKITDLSSSKPEFNDELSIGSNNWAISGKKSATGFPILANDPHRSIVAPSLRYLTHLVAPGWDVIGGGEPEIPGISIGHNGYGAWGLTVFRTDAEDLYVYELDPNDSNKYWHKGEWLKFKTIKEKIPVKGGNDYEAELKYSVHGPVTFVDKKRNRAYAVRCGWLEVGGSPYLASLRMNQSYSWDEFREACNYSNIPGENMVWADKDGNIGWQAVGIAPIRNTHSGLVPVMGDGNYEWDGYLPIVDKPNIFNPEEEYFATANQNVTPESYNEWNAIGFSWSDPFRGDRVNEILESSTDLTMKDMIELQVDYHSIPSIKLIKMLSQVKMDNKFNTYLQKLLDWDNKIVKGSGEALIYVNWEREIMRKYDEKYVPDEVKEFINVQLYRIINNLNESTNKERDGFLKETFISSVRELELNFGDKLNSALYGQNDYKHIRVRHPLELVVNDSISKILGFKTYPRGGNAYTPGSTGSNLSQSSGATFRVIIDTENWDNSLASNAPGQSGNPNSQFYRNLYEEWANDKYFKLLYSKDKILNSLSEREIFNPR